MTMLQRELIELRFALAGDTAIMVRLLSRFCKDQSGATAIQYRRSWYRQLQSSPFRALGTKSERYVLKCVARAHKALLMAAALGIELLINFGLHELCEFVQRLLPSKVTSLRRDHVGHAFLFDIHFGTDRNDLQAHGDTHLAW